MAGDLRKQFDAFLQEHMLAVSLVGTILSAFMIFLGTMGQWYSDSSFAPTTILDFLGDYDIWVLIFGLIIFSFSAYYLWLTKYYMDLFEEIVSTNSKKEFQKRWTEVEQIARYQLPKAYRKRVAEVREKFGLK
jgi:hypothetical protein|tara:strand:+ start:41 stop:439 length:399 start_codon:yes stop_codon:yes gene_type:complete